MAVLAVLGAPSYRREAERLRDEIAALPGPEHAVALLERLAAEKQPILEMLWDRLFEKSEELPVPESHLQLAEERLDAYLRNPERARSAYDIIDELANQSK